MNGGGGESAVQLCPQGERKRLLPGGCSKRCLGKSGLEAPAWQGRRVGKVPSSCRAVSWERPSRWPPWQPLSLLRAESSGSQCRDQRPAASVSLPPQPRGKPELGPRMVKETNQGQDHGDGQGVELTRSAQRRFLLQIPSRSPLQQRDSVIQQDHEILLPALLLQPVLTCQPGLGFQNLLRHVLQKAPSRDTEERGRDRGEQTLAHIPGGRKKRGENE